MPRKKDKLWCTKHCKENLRTPLKSEDELGCPGSNSSFMCAYQRSCKYQLLNPWFQYAYTKYRKTIFHTLEEYTMHYITTVISRNTRFTNLMSDDCKQMASRKFISFSCCWYQKIVFVITIGSVMTHIRRGLSQRFCKIRTKCH